MKTQQLQSRIGASIEHAKEVALMPSGPLTPEQRERYASCKARIHKGMASFLDVADALFTLRDDWLYREEYSTFEKCCQAEFSISARRARQICDAVEVRNLIAPPGTGRLPNGNHGSDLTPPSYDFEPLLEIDKKVHEAAICFAGRNNVGVGNLVAHFSWTREEALKVFDEMIDRGLLVDGSVMPLSEQEQAMSNSPLPIPESERVARPLTKLPREEVPEVWKRAVETSPGGKAPTGAHVAKVVEEHLRPKKSEIIEMDLKRLDWKGDISEATCCALFAQRSGTVTLGNGNVFDYDGCNWVTGSVTRSGSPGKAWDIVAECYALVEEKHYRGAHWADNGSGSYQGYQVILDRKNYRLGPKTIFRAKESEPVKAAKRGWPPKPKGGNVDCKPVEQEPQTEDEAWTIGIPPKVPPKSQAAEAKAKPEVLALAKRIYLIGSNAAGLNRKWGTASLDTHVAFLAVAQFHLDAIAEIKQEITDHFTMATANLEAQIEAVRKSKTPALLEGMVIGLGAKRVRSAELRSKIANRKITMAAATRAKRSSGPKDFVIWRQAKGCKPKFWSGPNAWTVDPQKAKHLSSAAAIMRLRGTRKFESCKDDQMLSLSRAVKMAGMPLSK